MLVVSGDYKSFQELIYPGRNEEKDPKGATDSKLKTNFELLKLVTRSPVWNYTIAAMETVRGVLEDLKDEPVMGSTEVVGQAIQDARALLDLELLYYRLLNEARIWDFRDLLISAVSLFGWPDTIAMLLKSKDSDGVLARIHEDWAQLGNSESVMLGLLDVFTSLMLQIRPLDQGAELSSPTLVEHARIFAESVQKNNADNMNTRPFIQWILAKTWWETRPTPKRPDGVTIDDFQGLLLEQGDGIHLPVFVPINHSEKPDWALVSARPNAAQRSAVEVALGAAMERDDLYLQALALKILCLQSQDPTRLMDVLSTLQLDLQGDMEGFLGTCLARYLVPQGQNEADEKGLLRSFKQLDNVSGNSYLHSGVNPSFLWARDVIQSHILAKVTGEQTQTPSWGRHLRIYGPRLPQYVATFIEDHFRLNIPPPMRVSFNIIGNKNTQHDADTSRRLSDPPYKPYGEERHEQMVSDPQYMPHLRDREDRTHRPASPVYDRTPNPPVIVHNTIINRYGSSSYDSSSDGESEHCTWSSSASDDHYRRLRAERERVKAWEEGHAQGQKRAQRERNALASERLERIGLSEKPEMPNLPRRPSVYYDEENEVIHVGPTGDQYADNGYNSKIPMGVKVDNNRHELSFPSRVLKDNTVTVIVRNTDNPEQVARYQMDNTGIFPKPDGEMDNGERTARYNEAKSPRKTKLNGNIGRYNNSEDESSTSTDIDIGVRPQSSVWRPRSPTFIESVSRSSFGPISKEPHNRDYPQPSLINRSSLPKRPTSALPDNQGQDFEEARPNTGICNENSTIPGERTEPTIKHHKQHLAKSTLRTQNRSTSRASSADSQPKPAAQNKKGTDWPKSSVHNPKEPSDTQAPHEALSEESVKIRVHHRSSSQEELRQQQSLETNLRRRIANLEIKARELRSGQSELLNKEREQKKLEQQLLDKIDALKTEAGGLRENQEKLLDEKYAKTWYQKNKDENLLGKVSGEVNAEARTKRRSTWDTRAERDSNPDLVGADPDGWDGPRVYDMDDLNRMDLAPAPPPRRSTVENAGDKESWGGPTAAEEAEILITEIPSKGEEASSKGPARASGNPTGAAANNQKAEENTEESFEDEVAKKMSERLAGANEYIDQDQL
ncbi:hypothetical protein N0V85_000418 [Neurospora sp. IMI 360204]|nr:hypothetical protein N0V85_000418 [Neurospora sp. IMI 360204]